MRKLVLYMSMTLDGFVAGPNDEFDDFEPSIEEHVFANQLFDSMDSVMFGRITYEGFVGYWDAINLNDTTAPAQEIAFARIFQRLERIVVSRTLSTTANNTIVIRDGTKKQVEKLKERAGRDMILVCGPELLGDLMEHQLVDEFVLMIKPRVLGRGKSLFRDVKTVTNFRLLATKEFKSGTVMHRYVKAV